MTFPENLGVQLSGGEEGAMGRYGSLWVSIFLWKGE